MSRNRVISIQTMYASVSFFLRLYLFKLIVYTGLTVQVSVMFLQTRPVPPKIMFISAESFLYSKLCLVLPDLSGCTTPSPNRLFSPW